MKKVYIIIISLVTVFCIVFGSWLHIMKGVNFIKSKMDLNIKIGGISDFIKDLSVTEEAGNNLENRWSFDNEDITKIKLDATVADVKIKEGSAFAVEYDGLEKYEPEVKTEGKTVTIKQPSYKNTGLTGVSINNDITVYIPAGTKLEKIIIECNVGDVSLEGVKAGNFDLTADVGEVELENVSGDTCKIVASVGEITVKGGSFDRLECEAAVGEVFVDECDFEEINAEGNVGEVRINLIDSSSNYNYDLSASLGGVYIDGNSKGKRCNTTNSGADKYITATADIGAVEIKSK